jgi:hypothetical protein
MNKSKTHAQQVAIARATFMMAGFKVVPFQGTSAVNISQIPADHEYVFRRVENHEERSVYHFSLSLSMG